MIIQFSASIDEVKRNKDRTLRIKLDTQELSPEESAHIFSLQDLQIWVAMAEIEIKKQDIQIPDIIPEFKGEKSPAETMKAVIYRIWEQRTDKKQTFPDFYKSYMFKLIEGLKQKLS